MDSRGVALVDADNNVIGKYHPLDAPRLVYALPTETGGHLTQRYRPPKPPDEESVFGIDYSRVIAPGVGITDAAFSIFTNEIPPAPANNEFTIVRPIQVRGRAVYVTLSGGLAGHDYQLRWTATDAEGNVWVRTGLLLVAQNS